MFVQEGLIARVRELCQVDERLEAALMYGSFASGEADEYSDVEFWLFFDPGRRGEVDPRAWCAQIAPVLHHVRNEFGADVVVFPELVRGEFHFATTDDVAAVGNWPARGAAVDQMIVLDRRGALRPVLELLPERAAVLARSRSCAGDSRTGWCWRTTWWAAARSCGRGTRSVMRTATCCGWCGWSPAAPSTG